MHSLSYKCCLSIGSILLGLATSLAISSDAWAYTVDAQNRTITVEPSENAAPDLIDALTYLTKRPDQNNLWTVKFNPGIYRILKQVQVDNLQNVALESNPKAPAILTKTGATSPPEYLLSTRFSQNVSIRGFDIYGITRDYVPENYSTTTHPVWSDQGLYFGSSNGVVVNMNRFFNIGNAAVRITTTNRDPVRGVNSFNSEVTQNYFRNVFQVTTTSNDTIHGGSSNYLFMGNTFDELRGSIKFASRTTGATNVAIRHNSVRSSSHDGIELSGYNNVEMYKNRFENIARHVVNCYSNDRAAAGFQWGENFSFTQNYVNNAGIGFRFSANATDDGIQPIPRNLVISDNTMSNITGGGPAISLINASFPNLTITNNVFSGITSKRYINIQQPTTLMTISGNKAENVLLTALK